MKKYFFVSVVCVIFAISPNKKIKVMKDSRKNKLIKAMIESNRGWRYTEMQQFIWNLNHPNLPFTREQRGYWSNNFLQGPFVKGYMVEGGDGKVYKQGNLWFAKWTTAKESAIDKINSEVAKLTYNCYNLGYYKQSFDDVTARMNTSINKIVKLMP